MVRLCKPVTAALLLLAPFCVLAQDIDPQQQTTVEWRPFEGLSAPGVDGSFVGVHNGALIIAGGASD